jgi:hypothetical protein
MVLGLAVLAAQPAPAAWAADTAAAKTLWQARWQYVRIVPSDGAAPNRHPAHLSKLAIRSGLAQLKVDMGTNEPVEFLTPEERAFYADQLSKALDAAGPDEDVVISTIGMRKTFIGLAEQKVTTTRVFVTDEGLNIVAGEVQRDAPNDTATYHKADPRLVSFADGRRASPAIAGAPWKLVGGEGVKVARADWAVLRSQAMETPEPGSEEAQKKVQDQVQQMQQQIQVLQQAQKAPPPATAVAPLPQPAPAAAVISPPKVEDRLRALDELKAKGLVTPKEYAAKRKQIIDSL